MTKILVFPDVHGSHQWEVAKSISPDSYDYAVFLGDYFDSWENDWPDQGENFKTICNFVREDPDHRKLLIGNHDWSYISGTRDGYRVSGHQSGHILEIRNLLEQNLDIIDLAFECDGWVFSPSGDEISQGLCGYVLNHFCRMHIIQSRLLVTQKCVFMKRFFCIRRKIKL